MPDPTPDPWAAAVEAMKVAEVGHHMGGAPHDDSDTGYCAACLRRKLHFALPHLLEAVVNASGAYRFEADSGERESMDFTPIGNQVVRRDDLLTALQRAAARLTDG